MRPIRLPAAFAVALAALLAACSSTTTNDAAGLAKAGETAAGQMAQNATLSAATYAALTKAVAFDAGFGNDVNDPATQHFLDQEQQIQVRLAAYGNMLDKLAGAYAALDALASYDATGTFSGAANNLCGAAGNLAKSMNAAEQVPTQLCQGVSAGAGLISGAVQAQQVRDASDQIEAVLHAIIPILADTGRRNLIVFNSALVQRQLVAAAEDGYSAGAFSCAPLLAALGAPLNLAPVEHVDDVVAKHPNLRRGCLNVVSVEAEASAATIGKAYDESLDALRALERQHQKLKAGAPLNLDSIQMIVANLQTLAMQLQPSKGK